MQSLLLIISGSVAAYKSLELIRLLREQGVEIDAILTRGGADFITPLAVASLTGRKVYSDLFSLTDETEMGHIQLSRRNDAILVAPASADILAKMAAGIADDLATTALLATNKPVFVAPAMNAQMWQHPATQRNIAQLQADGVQVIPPSEGVLACGEIGKGRMTDPACVMNAVLQRSGQDCHSRAGGNLAEKQMDTRLCGNDITNTLLEGKTILITAGSTHEPIDPIRYIGNHSSGKQGIAIAKACAAQGAVVHLVLGPATVAAPIAANIIVHPVITVREMLAVCESLLPVISVDIAICAAAVADWAVAHPAKQKIKKTTSGEAPQIALAPNPDILATLAKHPQHRPSLVIGFAAETENLEANARTKLQQKGCDWILANDVASQTVFGADTNRVAVFTTGSSTPPDIWEGSKDAIAKRLVAKMAG
jgi:phosphopantothenoylcysteine decarboxylase/phosphopantothenate--cysteine ligase